MGFNNKEIEIYALGFDTGTYKSLTDVEIFYTGKVKLIFL